MLTQIIFYKLWIFPEYWYSMILIFCRKKIFCSWIREWQLNLTNILCVPYFPEKLMISWFRNSVGVEDESCSGHNLKIIARSRYILYVQDFIIWKFRKGWRFKTDRNPENIPSLGHGARPHWCNQHNNFFIIRIIANVISLVNISHNIQPLLVWEYWMAGSSQDARPL